MCALDADVGRPERTLLLPFELECARCVDELLEWLAPSFPFLAVFEDQRGPRLSVAACRATLPFDEVCAGFRSRPCAAERLKCGRPEEDFAAGASVRAPAVRCSAACAAGAWVSASNTGDSTG